MNKTYIGDAVYAEIDDRTGDVTLTTEDGIKATNRIVLQTSSWAKLLEWYDRMAKLDEGRRAHGS